MRQVRQDTAWHLPGCDLNSLTAVAIAVNINDGYIVEAWDDRPLQQHLSPYWRKYWRAGDAA